MLSRKPQKAVHPTDPGQSGWWLLVPACGAVVGAAIPYLGTLGPKWAAACMALNAIGGLTATTPQFREWLSARFHSQQITETAGVLKNGISDKHISNDDLYSLRVHRSNRKDITDFVHRDIQDQLIEHLHNGKPILIEGPSMSGKTRLAIETIRSHWPDTPLWFPRDDDSIEKLLGNDQPPTPRAIVLLDDIDRFLSNQSLTLGQINQWASNSCIIIATMMHSQYIKYCDHTDEKVTGWEVINRLEKLTLNPSLSTTELNAVQSTSYADQIKQIKNIGLGTLLGCAEAVRAAFADELRDHSWCGVLIKAAADWRRIGLGPASREQLISLSLAYEDEAWGSADWNDTWNQATKFINHTVPLLRQVGDDRWEVVDIIADDADWKISNHTFASLTDITLSGQQTLRAAVTMLHCGAPSLPTNNMFKLAIEANPNNAIALGAYALFLKNVCGDMDQAQEMYQRAITAAPVNATILGNYATFLKNIRGDMDKAQEMYQRAIAADPTNATALGNYALFLETVRGDMNQAQDMHQRAIDANPHHADILGNYALFLQNIRGDIDRAQDMYQQAIDADPSNAKILTNYAIFLVSIQGKTDQAQDMFRRAITADPHDATALGNYALFLETVRGDMNQAQEAHQQAIDANPSDVKNLTNYALFLHNIRGDIDQAQDMYQQAIDTDPHNATTLGTYALFLESVRGDTDQAQDMYRRAIDADPHNATALGNYALFLETVRGDTDQAQDMHQRAIDADPHNANNLGNYAQVLFAKSDDKKAISLTEKAISLAGDDEKPSLTECQFYLFAHSPKHRKESGRALKTLLAEGVTTGDWSFEMNLERLRSEENPRLELLEAVAHTLEDGDTSRLDAFEEWRDL